ncbi:MAG: PEGA domain-containing protein [Elusimicrobiota bacterium]
MTPALLAALLAALCSLFTGCASTRRVSFISDPGGATVVVGARTVGETPVTVKLERKGDQVLTFAKDGYQPVTVRTTASNEWFGGRLVCSGTDGASGAIRESSPGRYRVTLPPDGTTPLEAEVALPQQRPPSPAPSEWPRECAGVVDGRSKEEDSYCLLMDKCRGGTQEAEKYLGELDYRNRTKTVELISRHIFKAKGTGGFMSWRFAADPALPDPEKACIAWFLRRYTAFKPEGAPEGR